MFEWWYIFWDWLGKQIVSDGFWKPYVTMGTLFWLIAIGLPTIYALMVIQPFMRYRRWKHPEEFKER